MTYSFRAECDRDVDLAIDQWQRLGYISFRTPPSGISVPHCTIRSAQLPDGTFLPDREVEFESSADYATLRLAIAGIDDLHVVRETLRAVPLSENTLKCGD